ncbi:undecaprenyldiphospho-muramoylpentapeptide beta-N-acetylglucosaminyltransferase [Mariprofundus sp. EBB-1]|uniref:undecaprenyldiphospho-muramoylpentapeptide beta-N-acetylglucosaminyltransferase n=1 Tax=Mariprofundus sp. EBB-1 TaxID=2650971 RepID=UPI000EF191F0|nr:undecaprenyldiphospho-muramoylpentapeptide beta-N-acetylglucosaminyltransferase [Mariprofundus sp. EBB-1]RLL54989.1 undecaprenyldiphospho-muramoylpentapeptide beta-N-acetylglucosaminyltransferase [Mariprofundus sp. EBB-1]
MSRTPILSIAGGGTGGHVMPALALADAARAKWPELQVNFIGAERGLEAKLLPERGENVLLLSMHGVKGAGLFQRLRVLLWELPKAVLTIRRAWKTERPDLLVGVGGYASISGVAAALISRIPVVLYEQNAMPGLVNRTLAKFSRCMMLGFSDATEHMHSHVHSIVTGNVVREHIMATRWQPHSPPRLLVLGGSQGALFLNNNVPEACQHLIREGREFVVTHIVGSDKETLKKVTEMYAEADIKADILPFCDDMAAFYASGDLMIARSGAMTVCEAACSGMPTLFVPLPSAADDHQRHNANVLANVGGALVLDQRAMTTDLLARQLDTHLFDTYLLNRMSKAALDAAPFDASENQLKVLGEYLPGPLLYLPKKRQNKGVQA